MNTAPPWPYTARTAWGTWAPLQPAGQPASEKAVTALLGAAGEGGLEILALGPLTNLALAMMRDPDTMRRVGHITLMGGAYKKGNTGHLAEFNLWEDAEAADYVFTFGRAHHNGHDRRLPGRGALHRSGLCRLRTAAPAAPISASTATAPSMRPTPRTESAISPSPTRWRRRSCCGRGWSGTPAPSYTRVELKSERAYGATVNDLRPRDRLEFVSKRSVFPPYNCQLVSGIDAEGFKQLLCQLVI